MTKQFNYDFTKTTIQLHALGVYKTFKCKQLVMDGKWVHGSLPLSVELLDIDVFCKTDDEYLKRYTYW